jgi:spermidine synthase
MEAKFIEEDPDQGVNRIYTFFPAQSYHLKTDKQTVDLIQCNDCQMLFLDGVLQSSTKDEINYHMALVHPLLGSLTNKKRILLLGGAEGATTREILSYGEQVSFIRMVDYDSQLVELMCTKGQAWSQGSFQCPCLSIIYDDAWSFIKEEGDYDAVIIDLTDPDFEEMNWSALLMGVMQRIHTNKGGFVMNAGGYDPHNNSHLKKLKMILDHLFQAFPGYQYVFYTTLVPSFGSEWCFVAVYHYKQPISLKPEIVPDWLRRQILDLDIKLLQ